eukprot:m.452466 g.452466  ORF g.452466 m.452466 type:complete len:329 (+) comp20332_c0_seq1:1634-2620(+)
MADDRRRWSKPPANGMTLASHDPRYFGASIGPIEEEDEEASTIGVRETSAAAVAGSAAEATQDRITSKPSPRLATKLSLLKRNANRSTKERESMSQYYDNMKQSVDSRNEMLVALKSQNVMLSRKLKSMEDRALAQRRRTKKLPPSPRAPSESDLLKGDNKGNLASSPSSTSGRSLPSPPSAKSASPRSKALQEQVHLLTEERNQLLKECAELRAASAREGGRKFKGMTVPEQAVVLGEQVELKVEIDELKDKLVLARAAAARSEWELEHSRLYARARSRTLLSILRGPLSDADRQRVVDILEETEDADADVAIANGDGTLSPASPPK